MKHHLLATAALALTAVTASLPATAGNFPRPRFDRETRIPKLRTFNPGCFTAVPETAGARRAASAESSAVLAGGDNIVPLYAPDGSVWYAVVKYDSETVTLPGGMATEQVLKGFELTVYNNLFNEVGKVRDTYTLAEGETRISSIQVDMTLTRKFFNTDDKYEVIVSFFCNTANYNVQTHSRAYSIGTLADDAQSAPVFEAAGYVIDADNFAIDRFSENYLITFMEDIRPDSADDYDTYEEFLDAYKYDITTYTKAGWSGGPKVVNHVEIGQNYLPGDGMTAPFFMIGKTADKKPAFIVSRYEKAYFANPLDFSDYTPSADNHLLVDVYTMSSVTASSSDKKWTASIPMDAPEAGDLARYYGIGSFCFTDDAILPSLSGQDAPEFYLTVSDVPMSDPDNSFYSVYRVNSQGNRLATLTEKTESFTILSPAKGENDQALFVLEGDDCPVFHIVDIPTARTVADIPSVIESHQLTAAFDRVKLGGQVYYVSRLSDHIEEADGTTFEQVAWIKPDGAIDHIDKLNLGKDVMQATVNISAASLDPYIFDTDADVEYMVLIKRSRNDGTTATDEVLLVADPKSAPVFEATPDDESGVLANISLINMDTTPALSLLYGKNYVYSQHLFSLPLTKFAGGDGSDSNPFLIATVADLQQMKGAPAASYKLANDIDATGFEFTPVEGFSGTLDGAGKTVSFLQFAETSATGIFKSASDAKVMNLTLTDPVVDLSGASSTSSVVMSTGMASTLENVKVYGAVVTGGEYDGEFGVLAGSLSNNSIVTGCYVANASIALPEASVGGLVAALKTGSSVKSSAFTGSISGNSEVGGIVGAGSLDFAVEDSHVDADIIAANTVGGIVGSASRGKVNRNVVEGTLAATRPQWKSVAMGGVAGALDPLAPSGYEDDGTPIYPAESPKVITNNVVAVSSMSVPATGEPEYPGQHDTTHRIVGWTSANGEPEIVDWTPDWEPIYSDQPNPADNGLENNYVIGALAPVQTSVADDHTSTEGKSLTDDEFGRDFLEGLGYAYGVTSDAPWSELALQTPYLHFEQKFYLPQSEFAVTVGETFTVRVNILSRTEIDPEELMGGFTLDYNESLLEMGDMGLESNVLSIGFTCLKAGVSDITLGLLNSRATVKVSGVSGLDSVADGAAAITFDGEAVSCPDAMLTVWNIAGMKVAEGFGTVAVGDLSRGVYVVSAVSAASQSMLKIAVK